MSHQAQTHVLNNSRQKGSHRLVLLIIANHAHGNGSNAFPSMKTLAAESLMSERQVIRIVADLERSGELIVERSRGRHAHNMAINMEIVADPNPDIMSGFKTAPTLTNPATNPDKSGTSTLTNLRSNPDKSDIAPYNDLKPEEERQEGNHTHALDLKCPVEMFKGFFSVDVGNNMRMAILGSVKDLPAWRRLLTLKAAFADKPEKERGKIQHWILGAYEEFLEKENGRNGNRKHDAPGGIGETEGSESSEDALRRIGSNPEF
jgi:hypothetical protein